MTQKRTNVKVLVTGGTGYIGSHIVIELLNNGYDVDIIDNLSNSRKSIIHKIEKITGKKPNFCNIDLLNRMALGWVFENGDYEAVIHLAGLKSVKESVEKPIEYYRNNVVGTLNLLEAMADFGVSKLIFASSATVYGEPGTPEFVESMETGKNLASPYARTKYMIEEILKDFSSVNPDFEITSLRFFNPIGNNKSGIIGENPSGIPNNIMPYMIKVANGEIDKLTIFGNDYDTKDGTCIRDYIYVGDIAKGHLKALEHLKKGVHFYNLGLGHGVSVFELVKSFEQALGKELPKEIGKRRSGDIAEFYANNEKARKELEWEPENSIDEAMKSVVAYIRKKK